MVTQRLLLIPKTGRQSNIGSNLKRFVRIDAHVNVCFKILKPEQRSSIIFVKSFCPHRSCSLCSPMAWAAAHCWSSLPGLRSQNLTKHLTCLLYKFRKSTTKSKCVFLEITQSQIEFNESSRGVQTCCALLPRLVCLAGMSSLAILNPEVSKWSQDVALVARLSDQNHAWYILVQFLSSLKNKTTLLTGTFVAAGVTIFCLTDLNEASLETSRNMKGAAAADQDRRHSSHPNVCFRLQRSRKGWHQLQPLHTWIFTEGRNTATSKITTRQSKHHRRDTEERKMK